MRRYIVVMADFKPVSPERYNYAIKKVERFMNKLKIWLASQGHPDVIFGMPTVFGMFAVMCDASAISIIRDCPGVASVLVD
ncbi:MAG: hypothetical protein QXU32_00855 [Nitrososphaerales archaeon]